jgi:starch synthase
MKSLERRNGIYIILGNGTPDYERRITDMAAKHDRLLFIRGYAEPLSRALYANGTMFLMPSTFEPCGISQMLAMRDGQPCLVHAVGGLRDTVMSGVNGFVFYGTTIEAKVDNFLEMLNRALDIWDTNPPLWEKIKIEAAKARFTWDRSAGEYIRLLYS